MRILFVFLILFLVGSEAYAHPKHKKHYGCRETEDHLQHEQVRLQREPLVFVSTCPFSCRTEGIPKEHCRDWREGNRCYVQNLWNVRRHVKEVYRAPEYQRRAYYLEHQREGKLNDLPTIGQLIGEVIDQKLQARR